MSARAVVLAAGKGTRMKSARPKVMHEICGRPMLWWVLAALRDAGIDDLTVVTNAELEPHVATMDVRTVVQAEQLGTGHAVRIALDALVPARGTLVVAYGDMPLIDAAIFEDVQAAVDPDAGTALALVTARMPLPSAFGRIVRSGQVVARIMEAKDCDAAHLAIDEMNAGIYAYDEEALRAAIVQVGSDNAQGEYYLTDTVELLIAQGRRVAAVVAADYRAVLGVNDRIELSQARAELNRRLCEQHMRAGVTIVDPATTYLEPSLQLAPDVTIRPNTCLGGTTRIGAGSSVGPNCRIFDAVIGARCDVRESVITASEVADDVAIGPYAHLRGASRVGPDVRIGNFVELKNADLGEGSKANHLAYLGDATIGERSNIGAGTITANFDGVRKNHTEIGADVKIGSNNTLVAPVTVGDGAVTGAGAVVNRDVEPGDKVAGVPARSIAKRKTPT